MLGKSWFGREAPPFLLPVQCGAMTVIWVSTLPPKEVPIGSKSCCGGISNKEETNETQDFMDVA